MSEFEFNTPYSGEEWSDRPAAAAQSSNDADQMSALLGAISKMMAESENRQSAALHEMQERISKLAANTRGTKDRLPGEFQSAFQQIEEAMEQLAAKINGAAPSGSAPTSGGNSSILDASALNAGAAIRMPEGSAEKVRSDEQKKLASLADHFVQQTNPLKRELEIHLATATPIEPEQEAPANQIKAVEQPQAAQTTPAFDPAGNPDDPWDESAAEQLTQLYENGEAGLPHAVQLPFPPAQAPVTPMHEKVPAPAPTQEVDYREQRAWLEQSFDRVLEQIAASSAPKPGVDQSEQRAWLEQSFDRVLEQITASAAPSPENDVDHIDLLGERLDQMEARLQGAIDTLPKHTDLAGLQDIESCIVEFTAQLERSQTELERVTEVETLVRDLATRLSEERLAELTTQPDSARPEIDTAHIAQLVAEQVSEVTTGRLISALPETGPANNDEIGEVKGLVNNLIAEQRNGGRQTTERLDLLQQATVQLLERLEKVESTQDGIAKDVASLPAHRAEAMPSSPQRQSFHEPTAEGPERARPAPNQPGRPDTRPAELKIDHDLDDIIEPPGDAPEAKAPPARPNRNNFVAEARKAAARANQRAANELNNTDNSDTALDDQQDAYEVAAETSKAPRSSRTRLAIAALALAVVGLGAGNFLFNMASGPAGNAEKVSTSEQPAKTETAPGQSSGIGNQPIPQSATPGKDGKLPVKRAVALTKDGIPVGVTMEQASDNLPAGLLARRQQQQELAVLSTKTGATQPVAQAVPTSLIPRDPPAGQLITGTSSQLSKDMPSALVGPLSLRLAAASGNPSATFEVGARFAEGKGVRQNFKEAAQWYTKSATRGFALAQYRLATLYERGLGVDKDLSRAKIWYERAARQGNVKSMHNLAVLTAGSGTGNTDYGEAARWFTEAANRGLADSQFNLAILYQNGLGVSKDLREAYQWFGLAARAGDKDADARRQGLISEMKPAELTQADAAILQWRRKAISRLANDSHYAGLQWKKQTRTKAGQN